MTREPKAESADEQHEPADGLGIIVELAELPPGTLLTVNGMAQIFGKSPNTIMRAVRRRPAAEAVPHFLGKLLARRGR